MLLKTEEKSRNERKVRDIPAPDPLSFRPNVDIPAQNCPKDGIRTKSGIITLFGRNGQEQAQNGLSFTVNSHRSEQKVRKVLLLT